MGESFEIPAAALPVAVIGVGGVGELTVRACRASDAVRVIGVSDRNGEAASRVGAAAGAPHYTDNRRLLAETRPAAVMLAVPPGEAGDILAACAKRGIHVWKELPLARTLAEGAGFVRLMDKADLKLVVGTQRRFAFGYERAGRWLARAGRVFLARTHYSFNWGRELGWRGDRSVAGGGALMELGYHGVDLIVRHFGLPEEVYGQCVGDTRPRFEAEDIEPIYDTEDTATVVLRYGDGLVADIVASRRSGPVSEGLSFHGWEGSVSATGETCVLRDPDGSVLERESDDSPPIDTFRRQVDAFARAVLTDPPHYECSGRENLLNLAVIEAAYLSDRTSQPETPRSLLRNQAIKPADCLTHRPPAETAD